MLVPYYDNKKSSNYDYKKNPYLWIDLKTYLSAISNEILEKYWKINWLVYEWLNEIKEKAKKENLPPVSIWDRFVEFDDFLVNTKLFFETWRTCEYGLWKYDSWTHHGIDLVMPRWTPIESFTDGKVIKIFDYNKKETAYWNCVVVQTKINDELLYFCYLHLDTINVKLNDNIKNWQIIGTCGNTWNSKWNHLHFQIDKDADFHPYYNKYLEKIKKYTIDPRKFLQENYKKPDLNNKIINHNTDTNTTNTTNDTDDDIVSDLITELTNNTNNTNNSNKEKISTTSNAIKNNKKSNSKNDTDLVDTIIWNLKLKWNNYIKAFQNAGIIKITGDLKLDLPLTRYQFTLILYRLSKAGLLNLSDKSCNKNFNDLKNLDEEFYKSLNFVVCNDIIHWDWNYFYPWKFVTWVQFLAILWRVFGNLKDNAWKKWYSNYEKWAIDNNLIWKNWKYMFSYIPRKEVFNILWSLVFPKIT